MGMFDTINFEQGYEPYAIAAGEEFQTKSVYCALVHLQITKDGKLIFKGDAEELADFHGDIVIRSRDARCFTVRFSHGTLEWVRPYNEVMDHHLYYGRNSL